MRGIDTWHSRSQLKRGLGVTLVLLLAIATGCGSSDSDSGADPAAKGDDSPHVGKRLAIVQSVPDGYNIQVSCGATDAGTRLGFDVEQPQGPKTYDPAKQVAVTNAVLARNPDALVYLPADPKSALQPVKPAVANGLKVAAIDTNLEDPSVVTSFIASDHYKGGQAAAEELIREIGGKGKVLTEALIPDHPITVGRVSGFESVIKKAPGIEYLGARYPEVDIAKIAGDTAAALRRDPDIKAIYTSQNLFSTPGVVAALRDAGLEGKVKVVGWDYDANGVKYLKSGDLSALVAQHPREMGQVAVEQLANAIDGKPVKKTIAPGVTVVTQENKDDPAMQELVYSEECG